MTIPYADQCAAAYDGQATGYDSQTITFLQPPELFMNSPKGTTLRRGRGAIGRLQML